MNTAQIHSSKPKVRFCAGSNQARGVSEIHGHVDDSVPARNKAKRLPSVNYTTKTIHVHPHHDHHHVALCNIGKYFLCFLYFAIISLA